jgi:hypothetical protein
MKKCVTQKFALLALIAALMSLGLTACKSSGEHKGHSEHPSTSEHPR